MPVTLTPDDCNAANARKIARLEAALAEMLVEILRQGFHGTAAVELNVNDGTIQHIRRKVDRIEK